MLWIDVWRPSALRGTYRPVVEILCELPKPPPTTVAGWQQWAAVRLDSVAAEEEWQPGRYGYTVERRDDVGRTVQLLGRGLWLRAAVP